MDRYVDCATSQHYKCLMKSIVVTASYYVKENGKTVAVLNGYTFCCADRSKHTNRWICTRNNICRVAFSATKDGRVIRNPNAEHNHPPPKYCIHNGLYMKLWFAILIQSYINGHLLHLQRIIFTLVLLLNFGGKFNLSIGVCYPEILNNILRYCTRI